MAGASIKPLQLTRRQAQAAFASSAFPEAAYSDRVANSGELDHRERFTKADSESAAFFKRSGSRSPDAAASSKTLAMLVVRIRHLVTRCGGFLRVGFTRMRSDALKPLHGDSDEGLCNCSRDCQR